MEDNIKYWIEIAQYDLDTALRMKILPISII